MNKSRVALVCLISFILLFFLSCSESSSYKIRLNRFYNLLDTKTIIAFEEGDINQVVKYLQQKSSNPNFKEKYEDLKKKEAIKLFNNQQTVEFFHKYFYKKAR